MARKKKAAKTKPRVSQGEQRLKTVIEQIGPEFLEESAKRVRRPDVEDVADRSGEILAKFTAGGALGRYKKDAKIVLALLRDYRDGRYASVSYWSLAVMTFTLQYVLKPIDIIPDNLPVIGQLDDAVVFSHCMVMVKKDLREYKVWRMASEVDDA